MHIYIDTVHPASCVVVLHESFFLYLISEFVYCWLHCALAFFTAYHTTLCSSDSVNLVLSTRMLHLRRNSAAPVCPDQNRTWSLYHRSNVSQGSKHSWGNPPGDARCSWGLQAGAPFQQWSTIWLWWPTCQTGTKCIGYVVLPHNIMSKSQLDLISPGLLSYDAYWHTVRL